MKADGGTSMVSIPATIDEEGTVEVQLTEKITESLIADAIATAKMRGEEVASIMIDFSTVSKAQTAALASESLKTIADADVAVIVALPEAEITLMPDVLETLAGETSGEITIEASFVSQKDLTEKQAAKVKGYETVINIDIYAGDKKVDLPITISIPYTLKQGESAEGVRIWHLSDDGNILTQVPAVYDLAAAMIRFDINHQSIFVAGYDPVASWTNVFDDVSRDAWYYDAVAYTNYHKLFGGYGDGIFRPNDGMTRAMFVQVLWNLEGQPAPVEKATFADVAKDAWYYKVIMWAAENNITGGTGANNFSPNRQIIRQEMATMMHNYALAKSYTLPENQDLPEYADAGQIGLWAETAAKKMSKAGVLGGVGKDEDGNPQFAPTKTATREEAAQMLKAFVQFVAGE